MNRRWKSSWGQTCLFGASDSVSMGKRNRSFVCFQHKKDQFHKQDQCAYLWSSKKDNPLFLPVCLESTSSIALGTGTVTLNRHPFIIAMVLMSFLVLSSPQCGHRSFAMPLFTKRMLACLKTTPLAMCTTQARILARQLPKVQPLL